MLYMQTCVGVTLHLLYKYSTTFGSNAFLCDCKYCASFKQPAGVYGMHEIGKTQMRGVNIL